ncbi:MAG: hypothetical protein ACRDTZ_00015 [Pseudonocardiaceae bacterium]
MTRLVTLPFLAATILITGAWLLLWALIGPVLVALAAHWMFGPASDVSAVVKFVCFLWGGYALWQWWTVFSVMLTALTHGSTRPRRGRSKRNPRRR